jgi:hypothetical protein
MRWRGVFGAGFRRSWAVDGAAAGFGAEGVISPKQKVYGGSG